MRKYIVYCASVLGILLLATVGILARQVLNLQSRVELLHAENSELRQNLARLSDSHTGTGDAEPRSGQSAVQTKLADALQSFAERDAIVSPVPVQEEPAKPKDGKNRPASPFLRMFDSDEAIESNARTQVNMQYAQLLAGLNLPADAEENVRAILADSIAAQIRLAVKAMQGADKDEIPPDQSPEGITNALRAELSKVLNADEMAVWEDYEANKSYYMMEQSYSVQLGMYAPTMLQETRETVSQVMAEEITMAYEGRTKTEIPDVDSSVAVLAGAMDRALERLSPVLSEEEYRQVERFIEQQNESMQASQRMMQSMMGTEAGDDAAE